MAPKIRIARRRLSQAGLALLLGGCAPPREAASAPELPLPRRRAGAPGGRELVARAGKRAPLDRDRMLVEAILGGNVPRFWRRFVPVELPPPKPELPALLLWVSPDYAAVGSDADYVRVPLGGGAAEELVTALGAVLPTPRIVDAIHRAASVVLEPAPLRLREPRNWLEELLRHEAIIERQLETLGRRAAGLRAGHKKDIVIAHRLSARPGRLAIYGMHRQPDAPIQPLGLTHIVHYSDYSHGVRAVSEQAHLDGRPVSLPALLGDEPWCGWFDAEGPVDARPYRGDGRRGLLRLRGQG